MASIIDFAFETFNTWRDGIGNGTGDGSGGTPLDDLLNFVNCLGSDESVDKPVDEPLDEPVDEPTDSDAM